MLKFKDLSDNLDYVITDPVKSIEIGIRNLILTNKPELGHDPDFGCHLPDFLFEECNESSALHLEMLIRQCLDQETRIKVTDLQVTPIPDQHKFHVVLYYEIPDLKLTTQTEFILGK